MEPSASRGYLGVKAGPSADEACILTWKADMTEFLHVLEQYCSSTNQPLAPADIDGIFSIDAGEDLFACVTVLADGRLELFSSPGYVDAGTLQTIVEDDLEEGIPVDEQGAPVGTPGPLMCWQTSDAQWSIYVSRVDGLARLSRISPEMPWQLASFTAMLEEFRKVHGIWVAQLQTMPAAKHVPGQGPSSDHSLSMRI
jgi:hypothetical protein